MLSTYAGNKSKKNAEVEEEEGEENRDKSDHKKIDLSGGSRPSLNRSNMHGIVFVLLD